MISFFRKVYTFFTGKAYARYSKQWTALSGTVEIFGKEHFLYLQVHPNGQVDFTLNDIAAMSIRCPLCFEPIRIGDDIILFPAHWFDNPDTPFLSHDDYACVCINHESPNETCALWAPNMKEPWKKEGYVRIVPTTESIITAMNSILVEWSDNVDMY